MYKGPPLKIVVAGKPSSGKGSISPMVSRAYRGVYVASGNLLRSEVNCSTRSVTIDSVWYRYRYR